MSKNEHEIPTSTLSIMEQIQVLIRPPPSEGEQAATRPTNAKHPYYKRPGRGHNHDLCDACEEGGDLLCCDRCPSSFHLQCHDPPLNEDDIPSGSWMCHKCRMTIKITPTTSKANSVERAQSLPSSSGNGGVGTAILTAAATSRPDTPSATVLPIETDNVSVKARNLRKRSFSRSASICSEVTNTQTEKYMAKLPLGVKKALDPNKKPTPLDELIKAASVLNPKQFELPRELEVHMQFPGSDRIEPVRTTGNGNKKTNNVRRNSKPYELDSYGCVPLPVQTCFYCKRSCKRAPLVSCDYCPLIFHQDCLDPPLTCIPTGLWMCPNHVENFADEHLLKSISVVERVRLWRKMSEPLDREAVKMEFFRRVHNSNPPFRIKVSVKKRASIDIPDWVKYHYMHPPPLLPSLRETLRFEKVKRRKQLAIFNAKSVEREKIKDMLLKDIEALKSAKAKYREISKEYGITVSSSEDDEEETTTADEQKIKEATEMAVVEKPIQTVKPTRKRRKTLTNEETLIDLEATACSKVENIKTLTTIKSIKCENNNAQIKIDDKEEHTEMDMENKLKAEIDQELRYLDVDLIKKLAMQRLQEVVKEHPEIVTQYQNRKANQRLQQLVAVNDNKILPSQLLAPDDVRRLSIMCTGETSAMLAQQQSTEEPQLHPALATAAAIVAADEAEKKYVTRERSATEKCSEIAARLETQFLRRQVRARAVLTPLGDILDDERWFTHINIDGSFFMRYRQIHIGCSANTNSPMYVDLNLLGQCCRVSAKHATIFYDEYTKVFELINYSAFGTEINGQLYTCNFTKPLPVPGKRLKQEDEDLQRRVEEILDSRRGIHRHQNVPETNAKMAAPIKPTCNCQYNPPAPITDGGWEGTAILHHGSLLRFGCISFVFSIPDVNCNNELG